MTRNRPNVWISALRALMPVLVVLVLLVTASEVFACPTCKDGLSENDPAGQAQAAGFFYSILFMMAMPFVLIGTFGGAAYFSIRRAREQQDATESPSSS